MSDDGAHAFVVIAMVGNPFSPWYAHARETGGGAAAAMAFSAMNVCIYARDRKLWALTERAIAAGDRAPACVTIGASSMRRDGSEIVVDLDERTSPLRRRIRGEIRFAPGVLTCARARLDRDGQHAWWPIAPRGRVRVRLRDPDLRFDGHGYHDANAGEVPLETSFSRWSWSRAVSRSGSTLLAYDVVARDASWSRRAWRVARDGTLEGMDAPTVALPRTRWFRVARETRSDGEARVVRELEDTPFYARAIVSARLLGEDVEAVHESVSLDRFRTRWVRALLGYRMASAR